MLFTSVVDAFLTQNLEDKRGREHGLELEDDPVADLQIVRI